MFPVQKCELAWAQRTALWLPRIPSWPSWTPNDIDKFCSIAFPACFALFNVSAGRELRPSLSFCSLRAPSEPCF